MLTKDLIEFGLSEKEAKVYLALLKLEIAGVNEIAQTAGINRSTAYVTLGSLQQQGFVSISDDKKIRQYIATSPEMLLRIAEEQAQKQENILKKMETLVPELKALHKDTKQRPIVKVFEGKAGVIEVYEQSLATKEKLIRVASAADALNGFLIEYLPSFFKQRYKLGIKMYGIHPYDQIYKNFEPNFRKDLDNAVAIPINQYKFPVDFAIYDNKISYATNKQGGLGIIIESQEISDAMKTFFDLAFEEAKRLNAELMKNKSKIK